MDVAEIFFFASTRKTRVPENPCFFLGEVVNLLPKSTGLQGRTGDNGEQSVRRNLSPKASRDQIVSAFIRYNIFDFFLRKLPFKHRARNFLEQIKSPNPIVL